MPSLEGPRAKIDRAREHAQALDTESQAFIRSNPYRTTYGTDPNNGDHIWRVEVMRAPPMRLSILVGDVVHNLRSCLDHLVWQLSLTTTPAPYERAEFPIYSVKFDPKRNECFDKRGREKLRDVPILAQKIIESVQPYHMDARRIWPYLHLALIHEISNTDKHRIVLIPMPSVAGFNLPPSAVVGFQSQGPLLPLGLNLVPTGEDGYEVFRLPGTVALSPQEKEKVKFAFDVTVQTSETGKRCNASARDMMDMMCIALGDHILPDFERFFTTYGPGF